MRRRAFGLEFDSDLALPEMTAGDAAMPADVRITLSRDPARRMSEDYEFTVAADGATLDVAGIRYAIAGGRRIAITAPIETPDNTIRLWLTGSAMAALLFQRGLMPVHANIVRLPGGGAAAFVGDSGAGKSTLAAALDRAGFEVLGDDLCAVGRDEAGRNVVFEGLARIKLWQDACARLGLDPARHERVAHDLDKWHVPSRRQGQAGRRAPLLLERVYLLDRRESRDSPVLVPAAGAEAAAILLGNAFRWEIGQAMLADARWQFERSLDIARTARVARFRRTFDIADFDAELEIVADDLRR